jgi:hypothetical protein
MRFRCVVNEAMSNARQREIGSGALEAGAKKLAGIHCFVALDRSRPALMMSMPARCALSIE